MNSNKRLILIAHDAAGANATVAYAYFTSKKNYTLLVYPKGPAKEIYKRNLPNAIFVNNITFCSSDILITGTSGIHSDFEIKMIKLAKKFSINKIITIVDRIENFESRFSIDNNLVQAADLPDEIWLYDKTFIPKNKIIADKVIYTQDLYIKYLKKRFKNNPPKANHEIIKSNQNNYILFLSEYIEEQYGNYYGFNEYDALENLLKTITILNITFSVFIKLHPAEVFKKYDVMLKRYPTVNIKVIDNCDLHELLYHAKIIFGIDSSVFKESKIFKKQAYSIQIGSINTMKPFIAKKNQIFTLKKLQSILLTYKEIE